MVRTLTPIDRLRIERTVWTLDTLVQSLPGRSRKAIRQEMRANLSAAAAEVGSARAVRELGDLRKLALGYLDAEYGEGRSRPRWLKAAFWVLATELVLLVTMFAGMASFDAGIRAANPRPDAAFTWHGLDWLGMGSYTVTYRNGEFESFEFAFSAWFLLYFVIVGVLGGRLWRLVPAWWHRRRRERLAAAR